MGIEGRDKVKTLESGAHVLSGQLGKTIQRLRKAYNLSLSELAEQSGVAKSIISQIERNETNPTLATIWRLSQALDVSIERVLSISDDEPFIEKTSRGDMPILTSEDGKVKLSIIGWTWKRKRAAFWNPMHINADRWSACRLFPVRWKSKWPALCKPPKPVTRCAIVVTGHMWFATSPKNRRMPPWCAFSKPQSWNKIKTY